METRIDFQSVLNADASSVFMIVSEGRRDEVQKALRYIVTYEERFKDWSLIMPDQEVTTNDLEERKLILFFPCESKLSHSDALSMVENATKVIVVDTNPGLAIANSLIFYIDHDQRLKEVKASENIDRLSGDKGLILKNLQESTNLQVFLEHVDEKTKSKSAFYLVFKEISESLESENNSSNVYVFPSKKHIVSVQDQSPGASATDIFCKVNKDDNPSVQEHVKSFIANCTYHRLLKGKKKTAL